MALEKASKADSRRLISIALVGGGAMGSVNAQAIMKSGCATIAAVVDTNVANGVKLAESLHVPFFRDFKALLDLQSLDAVFICTPHQSHAALGIEAAVSRKHIIMEKPIALTIEEASELLRACRENQVSLTGNFWYRYLPAVAYLKKLVTEGAIGRIVGMELSQHQHKDLGYWFGSRGTWPSSWRTEKDASGGGMLMMTTCHALDYTRYITQLEAQTIFSEYSTLLYPMEVEDTQAVIVKYDNSAIGTIFTSSNMRGPRVTSLRVWGTHGTLTCDGKDVSFYSVKAVGFRCPGRVHTKRFKELDPVIGVSNVIRQFCATLTNGVPLEISERDCWINLATVVTCYRSKEEQRPLQVPGFESCVGI